MMHRTIVIVALCAALAAPIASAGKPAREWTSSGGQSLVEDFCAFPVLIEVDGGSQASLTWFDPFRLMHTGRHVDVVTNPATGASVSLAISGVATMAPRDDGGLDVTLSGAFGFNFLPGDVGPGDPSAGRTYLFDGSARLVFGEDGSVIAFEASGTMRDVCALLE